MPITTRGLGARRRALAILTAGALAAGVSATTATANPAEPAPDSTASAETALGAGRYVVLLNEPGATRYDGGVNGLAPTQATAGAKFDARSDKVKKYARYLERQQGQLAASVDAGIITQTTIAASSFTAQLSGKQASELAADREVLMLVKDTAFEMDTWNTPRFLGLESVSGTGTGGVWEANRGVDNAGKGVVVGILDSGIWPESASFAGKQLKSKPNGKYKPYRSGSTIVMDKADGTQFRGACETGEQWDASDCNEKLIGARYYPEAFVSSVPPAERYEHEFLSTRDGDGHGSHTAGTAAGNFGVPASVEGRSFGKVSGMAPAAKIAAYKVCFSDNDPDTGGCYTSSTLDAVDDAIADGVDVINYSISGATNTVVDAVEYAFLGAADAGIFVAASAGNSGPTASTVAHNSPWVTTVAASTHAVFENTVVLGNGAKYKGASINGTPLAATPLVNSTAAGLAPATAEDVAPVRARQPRPRQGHRQGRGLRPRRLRPGRQERPRSSRRAAWAWSSSTSRPAASTPTSTRCPPCTSTRSRHRRSRRTPRRRAPRRHSSSGTPRAARRPWCRRSPGSPRADRPWPVTPTSSSPTSPVPA